MRIALWVGFLITVGLILRPAGQDISAGDASAMQMVSDKPKGVEPVPMVGSCDYDLSTIAAISCGGPHGYAR